MIANTKKKTKWDSHLWHSLPFNQASTPIPSQPSPTDTPSQHLVLSRNAPPHKRCVMTLKKVERETIQPVAQVTECWISTETTLKSKKTRRVFIEGGLRLTWWWERTWRWWWWWWSQWVYYLQSCSRCSDSAVWPEVSYLTPRCFSLLTSFCTVPSLNAYNRLLPPQWPTWTNPKGNSGSVSLSVP